MVAAQFVLALAVLFAAGDVSVHAASFTMTSYVDAACSVLADGATPSVDYDTPGECEAHTVNVCSQSTSPGACGGASHEKVICSGSTFDVQLFTTSDCSGTEVAAAVLDTQFTTEINEQLSSQNNGSITATYLLFAEFDSGPASGSCIEVFTYTVDQPVLAAWYQTPDGGSLAPADATAGAANVAATFASTTSTDPTEPARFIKFEFDCDAVAPSASTPASAPASSGASAIHVFGSLIIAGIAHLTS